MTVWGFCSTQAFGPNVVTGQGPCRERVLLRGEGGRGGDVRRGRPAGCKRHALRAVSVRATPSCGQCVPETLPGLQSRPECARCPGGGSKWRHSEHLEVLRTRTRPRTGARELGSGLESDFVPVLPPRLPARQVPVLRLGMGVLREPWCCLQHPCFRGKARASGLRQGAGHCHSARAWSAGHWKSRASEAQLALGMGRGHCPTALHWASALHQARPDAQPPLRTGWSWN